MPTLLELIWSDIPDAEKFVIEADDRPKEFNPGRKTAQSFCTETENTTIIFYFDGDGPEWDIRLTAVRFDGSKYRIKYKTKDYSDINGGKVKLGFNEVGSFYQRAYLIHGKHGDRLTANELRRLQGFDPIKSENTYVPETQHSVEWLRKLDNPVRVVISDAVTCQVYNDTVVTHGDAVHIAKVPLNRSVAVDEAASDFLEWWEKEGSAHFNGAPACVFALRRALSLPKDGGISKTCGGGRDWTGVGADKPVSREM